MDKKKAGLYAAMAFSCPVMLFWIAITDIAESLGTPAALYWMGLPLLAVATLFVGYLVRDGWKE